MTLAGAIVAALAMAARAQGPEPGAGDERAVERVEWSERDRERIARLSPPGPPPPDPTNRVADDPRAARLGQALFFDPRLSGPGTVSCATCHDPERRFQDGLPVPETIARGTRRTPSLLGVAHQRWFFWDGRADSLWSQALGPIEDPREMGSSRLAVAHVVREDPELRRAYEALFGALPPLEDAARFPRAARPVPDDPNHPHALAWWSMRAEDRDAIDRVYANVGKAIAAYERLLGPGEAPFDRFVAALRAGDERAAAQALDVSAQRGLALFLGRGGCTTCHGGPMFTDWEFHNTGAPGPGGVEDLDSGRYGGIAKLTASAFHAASAHSDDRESAPAQRVARLRASSETWGEFKTPSLRNVAERPPYMHAGQLATLEDVLRFYSTLEGAIGRSHHQETTLLPVHLTPDETRDLLAFLSALTGEPPPPQLLAPPDFPLVEAPGETRSPTGR